MPSRLALFPVAIFGSIMGWSGLTLSFYAAHEFLGLNSIFYQSLLVVTLVFFGLMALTYILKTIKHFDAVKNEFNHPIALHFSPPSASVYC